MVLSAISVLAAVLVWSAFDSAAVNAWPGDPPRAGGVNDPANAHRPEPVKDGGYSSSDACRSCHPREYESWQRSATQREEARLTIEAVGRNYPAPVQEIITEDTEPDIEGMWIDADRNLWVQTSRDNRERRDGVAVVYDVFGSEGHFERQVELVAPGDPERDAIYLLEGGRVVIVRGLLDAFRSMQGVSDGESAGSDDDDEEVPLEVICYTIGK